MTNWNEAALIADAQAILGPSEEVLAAGIFSVANLALAQIAGGTVGAAAGRRAGDLISNVGDLIGNPVLGGLVTAAGAIAGSRASTDASAAAQGVSVRLLVAITTDKIHVLNQKEGLAPEVASFHRDAVTVDVTNVVANRYVTLTDTATGDKIELHGAVGWINAQAAGDKAVLSLLQG